MRRSLHESLERLGLERLALVYLHDPEHISFEDGVAPGGAVQALVELRREGLIDLLGVAGGPNRGISAPGRVEETVALARRPIPAGLWDELAALVPAREVWLD